MWSYHLIIIWTHHLVLSSLWDTVLCGKTGPPTHSLIHYMHRSRLSMYAMKLPAHSCCADVNTPQLLTQQSIGHFYAPHTSAASNLISFGLPLCDWVAKSLVPCCAPLSDRLCHIKADCMAECFNKSENVWFKLWFCSLSIRQSFTVRYLDNDPI